MAQEHDTSYPRERGPGADPFAASGLRPADPDARQAAALKREGAASAGKHEWAASKVAYEQAIRLTPQDLDAHVGLALALQALNEPGLQQQSQWLRSRARACGYCADRARFKALERAGFFSAS
ncbi:MAG: hypothetical protein ACJ798_07475 [Phenylobacterium sp.]